MFATVSEMDRERIKNTNYQKHPGNPEWLVAAAHLAEITKVMDDKVKVCVIFYNNVRMQFLASHAVVDKAVFEERGMKVGDPIQVYFVSVE